MPPFRFSRALRTVSAAFLISAPSFATAATVAPSFNPPGGLAVDSCPIFIILGFDDNRYPDGMRWVLDLLKNKTNPAGTGNSATFDGEPLQAAFYHSSGALDDGTHGGAPLLALWKEAVDAGHETGDHTVTHNTGKSCSLDQWKQEIADCRSVLVDQLGINAADIAGFRTPYLDFNAATFEAIKATGLRYECTMTQMQDYNKGMFVWPYTLDNGFAEKTIEGWPGTCKIPGLWEIPVYTMNSDATMWPPITGFDSSILTQANGKDFLAMLKMALDYRAKAGNNRAPLTIGLHSDTYASANPSGANYDGALNLAARREALASFIDYALQNPNVRFVGGIKLIDWMENPVPLGRQGTSTVVASVKAPASELTIGEFNNGTITLTAMVPGTYAVRLIDMQGRAVAQNSSASIGTTAAAINLGMQNPAAGVYKLMVEGNGITSSTSIVVSH